MPRNRTLVMDCSSLQDCSGQIKDYNSFNPFLLTGVSKTGWNFQYEPLYFYNAYSPQADNIILGSLPGTSTTKTTPRLPSTFARESNGAMGSRGRRTTWSLRSTCSRTMRRTCLFPRICRRG